jgi:hypothetical protein
LSKKGVIEDLMIEFCGKNSKVFEKAREVMMKESKDT